MEDFEHVKMGSASFYDVALGIKWLKTLGDVMVNWQLHIMTFGSDTGKVTLKGDLGLVPSSRVPPKSMAKTLPVQLVDKNNNDYGVADMAKVSLNPLAGFTDNH